MGSQEKLDQRYCLITQQKVCAKLIKRSQMRMFVKMQNIFSTDVWYIGNRGWAKFQCVNKKPQRVQSSHYYSKTRRALPENPDPQVLQALPDVPWQLWMTYSAAPRITTLGHLLLSSARTKLCPTAMPPP